MPADDPLPDRDAPSYDRARKDYAGISSGALDSIDDLKDARAFAEMIVDTVRDGLLVLDFDLRVVAANESFYTRFGATPEATVGRLVYDLDDGRWDVPELRELLENVLPETRASDDVEVAHVVEGDVRRELLLNARQLDDHRLILLAIEDVTERRRAERALRESEERFALFAENAREYAVIGMDADARITTWSPSAERLLGWAEAEALGLPGALLFTDEDRASGAPERELATAQAEGSALDERWHVRRDGSRFWGTGVMVALRNDDLRGYVKVLRDNTRRKEIEVALRDTERTSQARLDELEAVYATAPVGLCVLDRDLRFVRINQHLADLNGHPVEAHLGRTIYELVPDIADEAAAVLRRILDTGEPALGIEITGQTAAHPGEERTWVENWLPLRSASGEVVGINVVAEDVTDRRRAELAVREVEEQFRAYADAAPAMLWATDPAGRATFLSRAWYEYTGQSEREALGFGWLEAVHPDDREATRAAFLGANARAARFRVDYRLRRHDGAYRWALDAGRPILDADGGFTGYVGSVIDIDDRKRAEDEVRQLNATLEARVAERTAQVRELARALTLAEQAERRRIAHLLHDDLQQRLHGLSFTHELLRRHLEGDEAAALHDRAERTLAEAAALTRTLSHEMSPPLLRGEGFSEVLQGLADRKRELYGLDVAVEVRGEVSVSDEAVRILLYRLLQELLFNVVKHAGTRRARVVAEPVARPPEAGRTGPWIRLVVSDEGAGFDPSTLDDGERGLGLPTVRERVELVGGTLAIESARGEGTRVTVEVPTGADKR